MNVGSGSAVTVLKLLILVLEGTKELGWTWLTNYAIRDYHFFVIPALNLINSISIIFKVQANDVAAKTIQNYFRKAGFVRDNNLELQEEDEVSLSKL